MHAVRRQRLPQTGAGGAPCVGMLSATPCRHRRRKKDGTGQPASLVRNFLVPMRENVSQFVCLFVSVVTRT